MQKQATNAPEALALSIPDAAAALGVGRSTVYKTIAAGNLKVVRIGRRTLVPVAALRALVDTGA